MQLSWLQKINLLLSSRQKVLVMGDSHSSVFASSEFSAFFKRKNYQLYVETVGGATISGLENPNSKTMAGAIFDKAFERINPDILICQIGEVDTGFVLWYRAEKYQTQVSEMLGQCLQNYRKFIQQYQGRDKTIVISAPLPTIKDDQDWGEVANARKEIKATQHERTQLTRLFNSRVESIVKALGHIYINLDEECSGENGLVADFLYNTDPNDHHYAKSAYYTLLAKHLESAL